MISNEARQETEGMEASSISSGGPHGSGSPAASRRTLGVELRNLRKRVALTLSAVASMIERSPATMSRLERGTTIPRAVEVNALLDLYEKEQPGLISEALRASLLGLVRTSRKDDWFTAYRDVIGTDPASASFQRYVELETDVQELSSFQTDVIPGLLQTASYARGLANIYRLNASDKEKERFVALRLERQRRMFDRAQHYVISEVALYRSPGTAVERIEQLDALATELANGRPHVTIQIAPSDLLTATTIRGPFVVMHFTEDTPDEVFLEHRGGSSFVDKPEEVDSYRAEFAELTATALDRDASLKLVQELIKQAGR